MDKWTKKWFLENFEWQDGFWVAFSYSKSTIGYSGQYILNQKNVIEKITFRKKYRTVAGEIRTLDFYEKLPFLNIMMKCQKVSLLRSSVWNVNTLVLTKISLAMELNYYKKNFRKQYGSSLIICWKSAPSGPTAL